MGTLQKRLPPLLRIAAPADIAAANRWLADIYRDQHNARFAVTAAEDESAFVPFVGDLDNTLCIHEERVVAHDNTVRCERRVLQIPEQSHRRHFVKAKVRVHEYPDGTLAIFHGPRQLARYSADGTLHDPDAITRSAAKARSTARACGRRGQGSALPTSAHRSADEKGEADISCATKTGHLQKLSTGEKTIPDHHAIVRELWGEYLTFTPGCRDRELFDADMRSMNPALLADALREGIALHRRRAQPAQEQRRSIHQIYARKVKELSSLYPFIFAVENGLRSALADRSAAKFGRVDWWALIRDARAAGLDHTSFPRIGTTTVNSAFVQAVFRAFETMTNPLHIRSVAGDEKSDEFYYTLSLGDLWAILRHDWEMTRGMFCSDKELGMKLDIAAFNGTMRVIKDARNEIYHSNPISNRTKVVEACERLLNGLNVHLGDYDADIGAAQAKRVLATVKRSARHLIPARPS